jgi:hypothetical protein
LTSNAAGLPRDACSGLGSVEASLEGRPEPGTGKDVSVRAFESVLDELPCSLRIRDASVELSDLALG